jgi:F0F1-type ATP synthase epsilon subunit
MSGSLENMRLEVFTPTALLVDVAVAKVVAEGAEGFFALLPRHIDLVAALLPVALGRTILYTMSRDNFRKHTLQYPQ